VTSPSAEKSNTVDVYLLGSGLLSFLDLTLETLQILRGGCKKVCYLHHLPSLEDYLKKIGPEIENLMPLYYKDGRDRKQIYIDIVNHVVACCLESPNNRPVALLMHGHPLVFSTISQMLIAQCKKNNLTLKVLPGISSLDRMFIDLNLDIGDGGIQIFLAGSVISKSAIPSSKVGLILFQIRGPTNNLALRTQPPDKNDAIALKETLLNYYPPEHEVYIVESAIELGFTSNIVRVPISALESAYKHFNYNSSLYAPPVPPIR
jgi:uncharacterized protein YabN with tetrapyrrole methylase and pyrophosphatase domain